VDDAAASVRPRGAADSPLHRVKAYNSPMNDLTATEQAAVARCRTVVEVLLADPGGARLAEKFVRERYEALAAAGASPRLLAAIEELLEGVLVGEGRRCSCACHAA
jgi:hypothetical protein